MVTDVTDTINITLVWGNIDNFQPLFDASLRDLREQIIEVAGADYVEWNEDTRYLLRNSPVSPYTGFIAVDFGASLIEYAKHSSGNWYIPGESRQYWKYTHPSIYVEAVLNAIERYHGIIIEGKTALSRIDGHDLLIPLVSKNQGRIAGTRIGSRQVPPILRIAIMDIIRCFIKRIIRYGIREGLLSKM